MKQWPRNYQNEGETGPEDAIKCLVHSRKGPHCHPESVGGIPIREGPMISGVFLASTNFYVPEMMD